MCKSTHHQAEPSIVILLEAEGFEDQWATHLLNEHPDAEIRHWPDWGDMTEGDYLIAWKLPHGTLEKATNLKATFSVGAGVDQLLEDPGFPRHVPLVRLVDPTLNIGMAEFVSMGVLSFHRNFIDYLEFQKQGVWNPIAQVQPSNRAIGIMGLGQLAQSCINSLTSYGFNLAAWGAPGTGPLEQIPCYEGKDGLAEFLARTEILVILTPLNKHTQRILDREMLKNLPRGASILNVARGAILSEQAVYELLNEKHIDRVWLDVFDKEPLPTNHWAWSHPRAIVTPHIAAATLPGPAATIVAKNITRFEQGAAIEGIVDPDEVF